MEPDDATDMLNEFEDEQAQVIINLLDDEVKDDIEELSKYDDDTAGSIMTTNYLRAYDSWDVKDAMKEVVQKAPEVEVLNTILVVDANEKLVGTLDLKQLIITKSPKKISEIITFWYVLSLFFISLSVMLRNIYIINIITGNVVYNDICKSAPTPTPNSCSRYTLAQ